MKNKISFIRDYYDWALLGLILLAGIYLRYRGLAEYYYNNDEVYNLSFASHTTPWALAKDSLTRDCHPFFGNIIAYITLKIADYRMFNLTFQGIIPGMATVVVFFLIGKRFYGPTAALVMALLANFGYEIFILSQVLRGYTLFMLFLALSVYYLMKYLRDNEDKVLWYSYWFMFAAAMTHFSGIIAAGGVAGAVALKMLVERKPWLKLALWLVANLIMAGLIVGYIFTQRSFDTAVFYYTPNPIPRTVPIWIGTIFNLLGLFSVQFPRIVPFIFLLALIPGSILLCRDKRWVIPVAVTIMLTINTVAALYGKYPFTAYRVCLYLLPYFALMAACTAHYLYRLAEKIIRYENLVKLLNAIIFAGLIGSVTNLVYKAESFRRQNVLYFTVKKYDHDEILRYLFEQAQPQDIIFAEGATANYLIYKVGIENAEKLEYDLYRIKYNDRYIYYNYTESWPRIENEVEIKSFFSALNKHIDSAHTGKVWYFRIGWQTPLSFGKGMSWPGDKFTFIKNNSSKHKILYNDNYASAETYAVEWQDLKTYYQLY